MADGSRYRSTGSFCAAPDDIPLHSRIEVTDPATGRSLYLTVRDRDLRNIDLPTRSFQELAGSRWRKAGRIRVEVQILGGHHKRHKHRSHR